MTEIIPKSHDDFRKWLSKNHKTAPRTWVILYKKNHEKENMSYSDVVDVCLCYGWIDSIRKKRDDISYKMSISRRNKKSGWSKINKDKVKKLIKSGEMVDAGMNAINEAKKNGSWNALDKSENLIIPAYMKSQMIKYPNAKNKYMSMTDSQKKQLLRSFYNAKKIETCEKRINKFISESKTWRSVKS